MGIMRICFFRFVSFDYAQDDEPAALIMIQRDYEKYSEYGNDETKGDKDIMRRVKKIFDYILIL